MGSLTVDAPVDKAFIMARERFEWASYIPGPFLREQREER